MITCLRKPWNWFKGLRATKILDKPHDYYSQKHDHVKEIASGTCAWKTRAYPKLTVNFEAIIQIERS